MKVIVSGASKTGTKSMAEALRLLDFTVYDYVENYAYLNKEWLKIVREGGSVDDFRRMYEGVDAVTDSPCNHFWEEIHKAFPDAKIVHMERAEDEWWVSLEKQLKVLSPLVVTMMKMLSPTYRDVMKYSSETAKSCIGIDWGYNIFTYKTLNELSCRMWYRRHNAYVKKMAPKDKLLIYNVNQGWAPLCQFLDKDIPKTPFPHKNKDGSVAKEKPTVPWLAKRIEREFLLSSAALVGVTGYLIYSYITNPIGDSIFGLPRKLLNSFFVFMGYRSTN